MSALWFWLALGLMPYWLGPIVIWRRQRIRLEAAFEPFAPDRHALPHEVATAMRRTSDALVADGFRVVADLFLSRQMRHVSTRVVLLEHRTTTELALVVTAFTTAARPGRLVASYVELPTKLRDGRSVSINNSRRVGVFDRPPSRIVVQLPGVRDPVRLRAVKRAYLERHYAGVERVAFPHQDDPPRFLGDAMAREVNEQVEAGRWWRDARSGAFRPTFAASWRMTWRALPPLSTLRRWSVRRRAQAILRELDMAGPDPAPVAEPGSSLSVAFLLVVFLAAVLVTGYLATHLRRFFPPPPPRRPFIHSVATVAPPVPDPRWHR